MTISKSRTLRVDATRPGSWLSMTGAPHASIVDGAGGEQNANQEGSPDTGGEGRWGKSRQTCIIVACADKYVDVVRVGVR
jgi:hypothetical protein